MNYQQVQKIAKDTIEYIKNCIQPGMTLIQVRELCDRKMLELGADSFWYYDIGAFTLQAMKQQFRCRDGYIKPVIGSFRKMILLRLI